MPDNKVIPVRVALRCRPLIPKEVAECCSCCVQFVPGEPQVILGQDKSFTYDYVFSPDTAQEQVYVKSVQHLVKGVFKGYNATVLAYGQTGSGKTYSMGGGYGVSMDQLAQEEEVVGIIPRVIKELFEGIKERPEFDFTIKVSYLEIHKEDLNDLLNPNKHETLSIREEINGGIRIQGLNELQVFTMEETLTCLQQGSAGRTTGATAMNQTSSRSHAIFTIHVERTNKADVNDLLKAKFHLVDLAGSERVKKTHAEGDRFKEGININRGLLALGNVISALGDESQKRSHIPYRDSKLTRLLQDSLGGNSHTVMIACVSPADSNMEETLSTLRYADRARKIKNKPVINRDPQAAEIHRLRQMVNTLQMQLIAGGGTKINTSANDSSLDIHSLIDRNKALEEENNKLSKELNLVVTENTSYQEKLCVAEIIMEKHEQRIKELKEKTGLSLSMLMAQQEGGQADTQEQLDAIKQLHSTLEDLQHEDGQRLETVYEEDEELDSPNNSLTKVASKEHTEEQLQLRKDIREIEKIMSQKQQLAEQLEQNQRNMEQFKDKYESEIKQCETQIEALQKEREELTAAVHNSKATSATNKVSEQRRKRLQELEQKMTELKKRLVEKEKMLKMKETTEKEANKLKQEIAGMKQQKVKLIKRMKEDQDNFRKWRQQKDKEVLQLKAKDRKRQAEIARMERKNQVQQNVLRRKAEEAAAANQRLKEALDKKKNVEAERKMKQERQEMSGLGSRVRKWLSEEFQLQVSVGEAKHHLESLLADRKMLSQQLSTIDEKLDKAPAKRRRTLENGLPPESKQRAIKQDIELRSAQISDLQQKLMDADQDEKTKGRWENVHTMVEAKCALKWLMSTAVSCKVDGIVKSNEVEEMKSARDEAIKTAEAAEEEIKKLKNEHQEQLTETERSCQCKVLYLLQQLNASNSDIVNNTLDQEIRDRIQFQAQQIASMGAMHEELVELREENAAVKKELTVAKYTNGNMSLMPDFHATPGRSPFITPVLPVKMSKAAKKRKSPVDTPDPDPWIYDLDESASDSELYEDEEDLKNDPDWRKTPMGKRRKGQYKRVNADDSQGSSSGETSTTENNCGCRGICDSKRCRCVKRGSQCQDACSCDPTKCKNKQPPSAADDGENEPSTLNTTFNVAQADIASDKDSPDTTQDSEDTLPSERPALAEINHKVKKSKTSRTKTDSEAEWQESIDLLTGKAGSKKATDQGIMNGGLKKKRKLHKDGGSFFGNLQLS